MDSVCFYCLFLTELKKEMHHVLQTKTREKIRCDEQALNQTIIRGKVLFTVSWTH